MRQPAFADNVQLLLAASLIIRMQDKWGKEQRAADRQTHTPPIPQPAPNMTPPSSSLESMVLLLGMAKVLTRQGDSVHLGSCSWLSTYWYTGVATASAPPMTKAREGSHALRVGERKLTTLEGNVMPEVTMPMENTQPMRKEESVSSCALAEALLEGDAAAGGGRRGGSKHTGI